MAKEGKKQRKYGRNSRNPGGGKNQEMRTARNKRLNIEKHGASSCNFAIDPKGQRGGTPKPAPNCYTPKGGSKPPKYATPADAKRIAEEAQVMKNNAKLRRQIEQREGA